MSLIHKALKKAEGNDRPTGSEPPIEDFVGEKVGLRSQLTTRTIVLLVVAVLALVFTVYKKFHRPAKTTFPPAVATQPVLPSQTAQPVPVNTGDVKSEDETPSDPVIEEGKKLFNAGKYDDALAKFLAANSKNPNDPTVYNNIGLIYKKKNDFGQAESFYNKALAIKPNYSECLNNLGVLKVAAGDPLAAAIYLKKAIGYDSTYADAYFNLAVLNDGEGNFKEAISNYKLFLQYTDASDESLISKVKERIEQLTE